jgi:hypothetical protein
MGQLHPLPAASENGHARPHTAPADVRAIECARCSLCGAKLAAHALRHHVVSPQSCTLTLTVCHTCHKAALGEGYRPVE